MDVIKVTHQEQFCSIFKSSKIEQHILNIINHNYISYLIDDDSIMANVVPKVTAMYSDWKYIDQLASLGAKLMLYNKTAHYKDLYNNYCSITSNSIYGDNLSSKLKKLDDNPDAVKIAVIAIYFYYTADDMPKEIDMNEQIT